MREVLYRDTEGLQSLVDQIDRPQLRNVTFETEKTKERVTSLKPRLGVGQILSKLGLPDFSMDSELSTKNGGKNTQKSEYEMPQEFPYKAVARVLEGRGTMFKDTYKAWCAAKTNSGSVFCEIEGQFTPAGWAPASDKWRDFANEQGTLVLCGMDDKSVMLGMSLLKISGLREGKISPTCHLAMRLRTGSIGLSVFGKMDKTKYIKPFFIALT